MQNSFRGSLSLLPCLVALALLPARFAKADTIRVFDVSGSAMNDLGLTLDSCAAGATCSYSGTLTVDVTAPGTVGGVAITLPGLLTFDTSALSTAVGSNWTINATNISSDNLILLFSTTPTPGSLVGFDGGTIAGVASSVTSPSGSTLYSAITGSITPQVTPVPEPSSRGILAAALLAFAGIIGLRKML